MNIEQEIRTQIDKNKGLKLAVGEINNHLSILEGLLRNERDDVQKQVEEAYQRGLEDGKAVNDKGCERCKYGGSPQGSSPCYNCSNYYKNNWTANDDKVEVGDEVVWTEDENVVIVVTRVFTADNMEWCDGICKDGKVYSILTKNARKTGRQFDIDKILEEMKE